METINKFLKEKEELKKNLFECEKKIELLKKYPNLVEYKDRWGNKKLSTSQVNSIVNDCVIKHSCGCCSDSPLYIYPFVEIYGMRIYSGDIPFEVGHRNPFGYGEVEYYDWELKMKAKGINEVVIERVRNYFKENPAVDGNDSYEY